MFSTPRTRPGNITVTKHLIGNVHTVLMIPGLTHIALCHFVTFHFGQPAGTVEVFHLCVLNTYRPSLTCYQEA